jgi:hypothetical protein
MPCCCCCCHQVPAPAYASPVKGLATSAPCEGHTTVLLRLLLPGPGPYMSKPNEVYKPLEKALTPSLPSILTASGCWVCIDQAPFLLLLLNAALQPHASCVEYEARESSRVFYCGDWVPRAGRFQGVELGSFSR